MTVNILGTPYTIVIKKYDEDDCFERNSYCGYCDGMRKQIVMCDMATYKGWEHEESEAVEASMKYTLRHEIVHAFFNESGLMDSTFIFEGPWPKNEEMIDWMAIQGPKIYAAWQEVGAI